MNNRRNLKENLTISNKQRFSIRKFSIGVASVMLGTTLYFMGGVGTSIVHADSVQEQPAQTSKLDTNSAQASSDATLAQQDSDQNQSQVSSVQNDEKTTNDQTAVKSSQQATNASAVKSNTQDSKKSVSDTNETKSVANKAQTSDQLATATSDKSSQQVAKTDTKNSNTLDIKQNKQRLADNVKLNALTDNKAQTDTQTNSKYSVTDNYPADLTNYLPSTFNNKQEYAFEWLRDQKGNNIILTTKRTGDGDVYVYQNGEGVGESVPNQPLDLDFGDGYTGTVYNDDNKSGLVQSNPVKVDEFPYPSYYDYNKLTVIYSSHAKDVKKGSYYTGISFFVPHKITQTVTYKDSNDQVIDRLTHTQDGLTGQSYTTGLPSGSDYVRADDHEYLDNITNNSSGLISEFHDGYTCTKDYHDGVKVTFTENDSEGIGAMDYVVKDHGKEVKSGILQYGNSAEYDKYAWNGWDWYKSHSYTIVNPYVPQTTDIVYQYKKLGNVVNIVPGPEGKTTTTTTPYTNDPDDPTTIEPINVPPSIPGYTTMVNGKTVSDKTKPFKPADLSKNTYITYTPHQQKAKVLFIDDTAKTTLDTHNLTGVTNGHEKYSPSDEIDKFVHENYVLVSSDYPEKGFTYDNDDSKDQVFEVHLKHGSHAISDKKAITETVTYEMSDGSKAPDKVEKQVEFSRDGYNDEVTKQDHWNKWQPGETQTFDAVPTPEVKGYTPDAKSVEAKTVTAGDKDIAVTITYNPDQQKAKVLFIDDTAKTTLDTHNLTGVTNGHEKYSPSDEIDKFVHENYVLVSSDYPAKGFTYDNDDSQEQVFEVHLKHGTHDISDKKSITETITYKMSDGSKAPDKVTKEIVFNRDGYNDEVTKQDHWNKWQPGETQTFDAVPTPEVKGYTPDAKSVEAKTVTAGDKDIAVTITYNPDQQKAKVLFIDDTAKTTLDTHNLTGVTNGHEKYSPSDEIDKFVHENYVLVSSDYPEKGFTYDNDDSKDQVFEVHLKHGSHAISDKKAITETVTYEMSDGSKAPDKVEKQVEFSRDGYNDEVTKQDHWNKWQPGETQTFDAVPTPEVKGYTPDAKSVEAKTVTAGDKDIAVTITYNPDQQKAKVLFIDDTAKTTLDTHNLTGVTNGHEKYSPSDEIDKFVHENYVLVSSDYPEKGFTYDNDDSQEQVFEVHLKHGSHAISDKKAITETVTYEMSDGSKAPDKVEKQVEFSRDGYNDEVTKQDHWNKWQPGETQTFDAVPTPEVKGYTPDAKSVEAKTVTAGDKDIAVTITYNPDQQKAKVLFIDDTAKTTLDTHNLTGVTNGHEKYSPSDEIDKFVHENYVLVSSDYPAKGFTYDNDDSQEQVFEVHLKHGSHAISDKKAITETVTYEMSDGSKAPDKVEKQVEFSRDGYNDEVTKQDHWNKWQPGETQTFDAVPTPEVKGYTPDAKSVEAKTVTAGDKDIAVTITYNPDQQKAKVLFIDDTAKTTLDTHNLTGVTNGHEKYSPSDEIDKFVHENYVLVSSDYPEKGFTYDNDDSQEQVFEVHLKHGSHAISDKKAITETVTYEMSDGSKAPDKVEKQVEFSRDGYNDEVTKQDHWNKWQPGETQTFDAVPTPEVKGYTPDAKSVEAKTVTAGDKDIAVTITYNPDQQKAKVLFIDDTAKTTLDTHNLTGVTNGHEKYSPSDEIDKFVHENYVLVSSDYPAKGFTYDNDDSQEQVFEVHLKHGSHAISDKKAITETVTYEMSDGSKAPDKVEKQVEFSRDGYNDEVTKQDHWNKWQPGETQTFDAVPTPEVKGYTPDAKSVEAKTVTAGDKDIAVTITYNPDQQKAKVLFIDDTAKTTLDTHNLTGVTNGHEKYSPSDEIDKFVHENYVLVSSDYPEKGFTYDNDDSKDQVFEVHLKHGSHAISDKKAITETVTYEMSDGSKAPDKVEKQVEFSRDGYNDEVTKQDHWNKWQPGETQTFDAVPTPEVKGYTPDAKSVEAKTVTAGDKDIAVTITYNPDQQKAKVLFIDDTAKTTLDTHNLTGVTNGHEKYSPSDEIDKFVHENYVLVSSDYPAKGFTYDNDDSQEQVFEVHLKHGTHDISDKKSITETITYKMSDGSKAPDKVTKEIVFNRDGYNDEVTKQDHWNKWQPGETQTFDAVPTPEVKGYTPDAKSVEAKTVTAGDKDIAVTITYNPDQQKAKVLFIDDTAKTTLDTHNLTGVTNGHEKYSPSDEIDKFVHENYVLVSSDYPEKGFTYDNDDSKDQVFEVHLKHGSHAISDKKAITETVTYEMSDGSKAPDKVEKQVEFSRDGYNDEVTKQDHWNKWQPGETQTFDAVPTPEVKGYTPDAKSVEAKTVTAGDKDIAVTITYNPDQQKAKVLFIDDTAKTTLDTHNLTGVTNGHEKYSPSDEIDKFVHENYVLVSSDYPAKGFTYDNDDSQEQVFEVHLVHTYEPVETSQTITETVHYIDANGKPVAPDHVAKVVIKVTGTRDKVTDSIIWNTPSTGHFDEVISPEVPNMTPDKKLIPGRDVQYGDSDITESVVYTPDNSTSKTPEKPDKPSKEVSKTPEKPNKPSKEVSKIPEKPNKSSKEVSKAPEKSIDSRTVDNHVSAKSTAKRELPQTGATTNTGIWAGLVSMIASLGLLGASKKRKKN